MYKLIFINEEDLCGIASTIEMQCNQLKDTYEIVEVFKDLLIASGQISKEEAKEFFVK